MNKTWAFSILAISFTLLAILRAYEIRAMSGFYRADKVIKLDSFKEARVVVNEKDLDLLELWESILTGRSAPLSKMMKEHYKSLGLNHIFTPSGFHLSAVLFPFMKLFRSVKTQFVILLLVGSLLLFLPGFSALKRMVMIKASQKLYGLHAGFIIALILDVFFGSFQTSALSFTYSFLFIGIIYAGFEGSLLVVWFFAGQMVLCYFQGNDISPLLLVFSPILNFIFAALMPVLFLLSFPLWEWQLHTGIFLLKNVQALVDFCASMSLSFPVLEINMATLLIFLMLLLKMVRPALWITLFFCTSLNPDTQRVPGMSRYEFVPRGEIVRRVYSEKYVNVYFRDGRCRMKLVRGFWYENCSPKRRSSKRKKIS